MMFSVGEISNLKVKTRRLTARGKKLFGILFFKANS